MRCSTGNRYVFSGFAILTQLTFCENLFSQSPEPAKITLLAPTGNGSAHCSGLLVFLISARWGPILAPALA